MSGKVTQTHFSIIMDAVGIFCLFRGFFPTSFFKIYVSLKTRRSNYFPVKKLSKRSHGHPDKASDGFEGIRLAFSSSFKPKFFPFCISTAAFNLTHRCTSCNTGSVNFCPASSALSPLPSALHKERRNPQYLRFIFQDVEAK